MSSGFYLGIFVWAGEGTAQDARLVGGSRGSHATLGGGGFEGLGGPLECIRVHMQYL